VVRRVRVRAADVSTDPRARRRRTIPKQQLVLALHGLVEHVYAYSFIATNADVSTPAKAAAHEAWHRMRTDIKDPSATPNTAPPCATCPRPTAP
jgi:hypothetical protein